MTLPQWLLNAYIAMLPSLEAERSIKQTQATAIGSGSMEKDASRQIWNSWNRLASGPKRRNAPKLSTEQRLGMARAVGIGVQIVPKKD